MSCRVLSKICHKDNAKICKFDVGDSNLYSSYVTCFSLFFRY